MPIRLSGLVADCPTPNVAIGAFYFATDEGKVYESDGTEWTERRVLDKRDVAGYLSGPDAARPASNQALGWVYNAIDGDKSYEGFPTGWHTLSIEVTQMGLVNLRYWMTGQFGICLHSTGPDANVAQTSKLLEITDAAGSCPYLLHFDQYILTPFTGPGKFDLLERDASDVDVVFFDCITVNTSPLLTSVGDNFTADMVGDIVTMVGVPAGTTVLSYQNPKQVTLSANATASAPAPGIQCSIGGKTQVTLATKAGFTDGVTTGGWSHFSKVVMSNKAYRVAFVPGTAGDGAYSMKLSGLNQPLV